MEGFNFFVVDGTVEYTKEEYEKEFSKVEKMMSSTMNASA